MSISSSQATIASENSVFAYVQIAATVAALYDHILFLGSEIELIWGTTPSLVTMLYIIDRYLGDAKLGLIERAFFVRLFYELRFGTGLQLFRFRAWGTLAYSWATQAIMLLRIYAMYRRSTKILTFLLLSFFAEIVAIAIIISHFIGPGSGLEVELSNRFSSSQAQFCVFFGVNGSFTYLLIPVLCFESVLFLLAAKVYFAHLRDTNELRTIGGPREMNSFTKVLARDSIFYFFMNLVMCAVVMGIWQSVTSRYANICVPLVMLLEILVGTRLVINFRERFYHPDRGTVVINRYSEHVGHNFQMDQLRIACEVESITVIDGEKC
ncbi:hypothetical protein EDD16DRAFT_1805399 [Pisolithus croceorrhizus]|nr:hypothetical protein EDD16DRAFT_1805399 [Pisolithus croceorrhizus]